MCNKELRLEFFKKDLRQKEREKARIWESFWWILWIFLPVIEWTNERKYGK